MQSAEGGGEQFASKRVTVADVVARYVVDVVYTYRDATRLVLAGIFGSPTNQGKCMNQTYM